VSDRAKILVATEELLAQRMTRRIRFCGERWFVLRFGLESIGPGRHHFGRTSSHGADRRTRQSSPQISSIAMTSARRCGCFWRFAGIANEIFNVADDAPATKAEIPGGWRRKCICRKPRFTGEPAVGRRSITPDRLSPMEKLKRLLGWRPVLSELSGRDTRRY